MLDSTRRHSILAEASRASYATITAELAEAHAAHGEALRREIELQTLWGLVWGDPSAAPVRIERPERAELRATFGLHEGNRKERRRERALARRR